MPVKGSENVPENRESGNIPEHITRRTSLSTLRGWMKSQGVNFTVELWHL